MTLADFRPSCSQPQRDLTLGPPEVGVWLADLDAALGRADDLVKLLSADEKERAARFYARENRERFIVSRGLLRRILAAHSGFPARDLTFSYGPFGKPSLEARWACGALEFNVAHSGGLALFAVSRGQRVGVDLERIRADVSGEEIASQSFAPAEVATIERYPEALRHAAFFRCWARKEAYVKARGEGLSLPLDQFSVTHGLEEQEVVEDGAFRWFVTDLKVDPRYAAALAIEGCEGRIRRFVVGPDEAS